jgi:hypothetical protein
VSSAETEANQESEGGEGREAEAHIPSDGPAAHSV